MIMNCIEHNSELIRNLTFEIEDLRKLVKNSSREHHYHRRSNSSSGLASPWLVPSLGECRGITILSFIFLPFCRVISWVEKLSYRIGLHYGTISPLVGYLCIPLCECLYGILMRSFI